MSRNTTVAPRTPWLLPVILALVVAAIVLAVIFGPRVKDALSTATATPVPPTATVTSTPAATAPPANAAVLPSATASTGVGVVTPLPNATPVPTQPGVQLGEISLPAHDVAGAQAAADSGNRDYLFYLDPRQVVQKNLPHYGFTKGFEIVAPAPAPTPTPYISPGNGPAVKFVVSYQGHIYTVFTTQNGKRGPKGIWTIVTILPGRQ